MFITDEDWEARHDVDGDGVRLDVDCDDGDPEIGAATTWYADGDADGYGDAALTAEGCDAPEGYVAEGTDCDDADATIWPGAPESCDEIDHDCDGVAVEDDAEDAPRWHPDLDGDGYGDPATLLFACEAPPDTSDNDDDCDDADPLRYPGAEERCGTGLIDDCRLTPAEAFALCDREGALTTSGVDGAWRGEGIAHGAGWALSGAGDVDGDGLDDLLIGAPNANLSGGGAGAVYLLRGPTTDTAALADAHATLLGTESGGNAGFALDGVGDVNGDGLADLLVGAPFASDSDGVEVGVAYLVLGPVQGDQDLAQADATLLGDAGGDEAGRSLRGVGDLDGDGLPDLAVAALGADGAGLVAVFASPVTGTRSLQDADLLVVGDAPETQLGAAIADGHDFDGDGLDDLSVGGPGTDASAALSGAAYVFTSRAADRLEVGDAELQIVSTEARDDLGYALAGVPDLDGDGRDELLIGAPKADTNDVNAGAAYLFYGGEQGQLDELDYGVAMFGEGRDDEVGFSVAALQTPAGVPSTLLVGAIGQESGGFVAGRAYAVHAPPADGVVRLADADLTLTGPSGLAGMGFALDDAGDVDGDGVHDAIIGAPGEALATGAAYLVLGSGY